MEPLEILATTVTTTATLFGLGFVNGLNIRQYIKARNSLRDNSNMIDTYERSIRDSRRESIQDSIIYYLGYFGRHLAYNQIRKTQ